MTTTSVGVQELRTRIGEKAKAEPQHRFWGLYTHVWKLDVLREAYRLAKQNNGAPGVDGVTFERVEREGVEPLLESLSRELRDKSYEPLPSRHVNIPKEGGKVRGLKIPAIRDRVVQGAVRLILEPIFEADFQPGSYGYRPGRSAHDALERVRVGQITLDEVHRQRLQIAAVRSGPNQRPDLPTGGSEGACNGGTDETRRAGDERLQAMCPSRTTAERERVAAR